MRIFRTERLWVGALLVGVVLAGIAFALCQPDTRPRTIGILVRSNRSAVQDFLTGIGDSLEWQGYFYGQNLILRTIRQEGKDPERIVKQLAGLDLLVVADPELPLQSIRSNLRQPVLFGFIAKPVSEKLKNVIEKEPLMTGVSFLIPYERTLELAQRICGRYRRLTVILPPRSAWLDGPRLRKAAAALGITVSVRTLSPDRIPELTTFKGTTDLIYLPDEPVWVARRRQIAAVAAETGLPIIGNSPDFRDIAVFVNYPDTVTMGEIAGQMLIKIMHGSVTRYMPIEFSNDFRFVVNLTNCRRLNLPIAEEDLSYANEIIQ